MKGRTKPAAQQKKTGGLDDEVVEEESSLSLQSASSISGRGSLRRQQHDGSEDERDGSSSKKKKGGKKEEVHLFDDDSEEEFDSQDDDEKVVVMGGSQEGSGFSARKIGRSQLMYPELMKMALALVKKNKGSNRGIPAMLHDKLVLANRGEEISISSVGAMWRKYLKGAIDGNGQRRLVTGPGYFYNEGIKAREASDCSGGAEVNGLFSRFRSFNPTKCSQQDVLLTSLSLSEISALGIRKLRKFLPEGRMSRSIRRVFIMYAKELNSRLADRLSYGEEDVVSSYKKFVLLWVLFCTQTESGSHTEELEIKVRIASAETENWLWRLSDVAQIGASSANGGRQTGGKSKHREKVPHYKQQIMQGKIGPAYKAVTSTTVPLGAAESLSFLEDQYQNDLPHSFEKDDLDVGNFPALVVTGADVMKAMKKIDIRKTSSCDAVVYAIAKPLFVISDEEDPQNEDIIELNNQWATFINFTWGKFKMPAEILQHLNNSTASVISKEMEPQLVGGVLVQKIKHRGIGNATLMGKIIDTIVMASSKSDYAAMNGDHQLGVGKRGGVQAFNGIATLQMESDRKRTTWFSDKTGAFLKANRAVIIRGLKKFAKNDVLHAVNRLVGENITLHKDCENQIHLLQVAQGQVMGHGASPPWYTAGCADHNAEKRRISIEGGGNATSYLDDDVNHSDFGKICECLQYELENGREIGSVLNMSKQRILLGCAGDIVTAVRNMEYLYRTFRIPMEQVGIHPGDLEDEARFVIAKEESAYFDSWSSGLSLTQAQQKAVVQYGHKLGGVAIGSDEFVLAFLEKVKSSKFLQEFAALKKLAVHDPQCAFLLLLQCTQHEVNHYLQDIRPDLVVDFTIWFKDQQKSLVASILQVDDIPDSAMDILGILHGGLGDVSMTADAAFVGARVTSMRTVCSQVPEVRQMLANELRKEDELRGFVSLGRGQGFCQQDVSGEVNHYVYCAGTGIEQGTEDRGGFAFLVVFSEVYLTELDLGRVLAEGNGPFDAPSSMASSEATLCAELFAVQKAFEFLLERNCVSDSTVILRTRACKVKALLEGVSEDVGERELSMWCRGLIQQLHFSKKIRILIELCGSQDGLSWSRRVDSLASRVNRKSVASGKFAERWDNPLASISAATLSAAKAEVSPSGPHLACRGKSRKREQSPSAEADFALTPEELLVSVGNTVVVMFDLSRPMQKPKLTAFYGVVQSMWDSKNAPVRQLRREQFVKEGEDYQGVVESSRRGGTVQIKWFEKTGQFNKYVFMNGEDDEKIYDFASVVARVQDFSDNSGKNNWFSITVANAKRIKDVWKNAVSVKLLETQGQPSGDGWADDCLAPESGGDFGVEMQCSKMNDVSVAPVGGKLLPAVACVEDYGSAALGGCNNVEGMLAALCDIRVEEFTRSFLSDQLVVDYRPGLSIVSNLSPIADWFEYRSLRSGRINTFSEVSRAVVASHFQAVRFIDPDGDCFVRGLVVGECARLHEAGNFVAIKELLVSLIANMTPEDGEEGQRLLALLTAEFSQNGSIDSLERVFNSVAVDSAVCLSIRRRFLLWVRGRLAEEGLAQDTPPSELLTFINVAYPNSGLDGFMEEYGRPKTFIHDFLMPVVGEMLNIKFTVWSVQMEEVGERCEHCLLASVSFPGVVEQDETAIMDIPALESSGAESGGQSLGPSSCAVVNMIYFGSHVDLLSRNFYMRNNAACYNSHQSKGPSTSSGVAKLIVGQATEILISTCVVSGRAGWSAVITESSGKDRSVNIVGEMCGELTVDTQNGNSGGAAPVNDTNTVLEALALTFGQVMHKVHANLRVVVPSSEILQEVVQACFAQCANPSELSGRLGEVFKKFQSNVTFSLPGSENTWWQARGQSLARAAIKGKRYHEGAPGYIINPRLQADDHDKHRKKKRKSVNPSILGKDNDSQGGDPARSVTDFGFLESLESLPMQPVESQVISPYMEGLFAAIRRLGEDDPSVCLRWLLSLSDLGLNKLQSKLSAVRKEIRKETVVAQMTQRGDAFNLSSLMSALHKESTAVLRALPVDEHSTFSAVEYRTMLRQFLQMPNPVVESNPGIKCACDTPLDVLNRVVSCCKCQNNLSISVHNEVQRVLVELCVASKSQCTVKVRKMYEDRNPGVNKEADVIIDGSLAVDVRISAVGTQEISMKTALTENYTVLRGEREKRSQYNRVKDQTRYTLVPFVMDSQGQMGPSAMALVRKLCSRHAISTNIPINIIQNYWLRKFSCKLQKAIARRVISKVEMAVSLKISRNFPFTGIGVNDTIRHSVSDSLSGMSPRDTSWEE